MTTIPEVELPYSKKFVERVSLNYLHLRKLAAGALASRDMHSDGYWKVESRSAAVGYVALRKGRPYRIIGGEFTSFDDFLTWLGKQSGDTEMFLTCRFLPDDGLKYVVRCLEEQPVLNRLKASAGQIAELRDTLGSRSESGLLRLESSNGTTLIPISEGRPVMAMVSGGTLNPDRAADLLRSGLPDGTQGYFYSGETPELSAVGLTEIPLLLGAFNKWLLRMSSIWPESFGISVKLFGKLREKRPFVKDLILKPDGLSLRGPFSQPGKLPGVVIVLARAIAKRYQDPDKALKLFREVNMAKKHALSSIGLGNFMGMNGKG